VIRLLVVAILVLVVARAFWRVVDGILDGARSPDARRRTTAVKLAHMSCASRGRDAKT